MNLPYITADATGPKHLALNITRAKIRSIIEDLVASSIESLKAVLKDADKGKRNPRYYSCGWPNSYATCTTKVAEFFGKEARKDVNPDEAVAIGAAVQGVLKGCERCSFIRRNLHYL